MNGKFQSGQRVFLTGGNTHLIKEATVLKYTRGFYTIRFENGGAVPDVYIKDPKTFFDRDKLTEIINGIR